MNIKTDSELSTKMLWDSYARQQVISRQSKSILVNAFLVFVLLTVSHVDVILTRKQIELSQFLTIPVSLISLAAIIYGVVQIRRVGQVLGRDNGDTGMHPSPAPAPSKEPAP